MTLDAMSAQEDYIGDLPEPLYTTKAKTIGTKTNTEAANLLVATDAGAPSNSDMSRLLLFPGEVSLCPTAACPARQLAMTSGNSCVELVSTKIQLHISAVLFAIASCCQS